MSYQCYLLLFTPFVLQELHVLSMLFVIIYSICFAGGSCLINVICYYLLHLFCRSCLINVICYYLLHLFCRRFMSYQCYLLLFTPFVLQVMSYQCYLLLFTPFVLQEVHVLSMLFVIIYSICFAGHVLSMLFVIIYSNCFAGGSCLINVICYYLLHLFCRRFMSYQCYLLLFTPFVLQEVHVLSMLFVIIYSICFAGGSCLINVICYYLLHLFCRRFMSYQCYLLLFTPFVLQEVHVLSMLFVIIYSICFAGGSCLINVICYYLLHLFCRSCLINVICYYLLRLFCEVMSYQCYLLLFTPFVLQEVHVLSMLFVIIYSNCFAGGSCLINVICYYLLHLFCRRFMSYQCYLLLFTPFVLQVMSYQCYLLLFTPFVLQEVHVLSMLFIIYSICFAGGSCLINVICYYLLHLFCRSCLINVICYYLLHLFCRSCLINVICYYLLHLFCRRFMSYQCYLLVFTPFVLQEVHVLSMLFVIIYSICFAAGSCLINVICYYLLHLFCRSCLIKVIIFMSCLINVICYYLLHLFCRRSCLINVICYYLLHLFCRRFMSYQCYLLLFTPFVLQEVHVLSMLFVIIYQCYLLLFPFVLQEVHVLSMLFVIIYSICFAGHVLSMLFVIIYSICFAGGSCLINVICYYLLHLFCRRFMSYQCYLLLFTPFVLQVMSYQCYLLLFTPFVLQEVHVLSMLFVIIYSICFAGNNSFKNFIKFQNFHKIPKF